MENKPSGMTKELKDYLHLYLGCEVLAVGTSEEYDDDYFGIGDIGRFTLINNGGIQIHASPDTDNYKYGIELKDGQYVCGYNELFQTFKPILRPLSDMTEKEAFGWASLKVHPMRVLEILQITNDGIEFKYESFEQDRKMHALPDELSPEMFRLLCKARFDLFGLIESGLAIDKTTLNTKTP